MKTRVYVIFGSEFCSIYENGGLDEIIDEVQVFEFDTEREAECFCLGIRVSTGYLESLIIEEDEYLANFKN